MRNKLFKLCAVLLTAVQIVSLTAFAAVTSPTDGTGDYFWYEDFNGETHDLKLQSGMTEERFTRADPNKGIALKSPSDASKYAYVDFAKLDFSKPLVISYDVITTEAANMWLNVCYGASGTVLASLAHLNSDLTVSGYEYNTASEDALVKNTDGTIAYAKNAAKGTKETKSAATYAKGKAINVLASLNYDSSTQILTVKQYFDDKPLLKADGTQYEYKIKRDDMAAAMAGKITLRFYVKAGTTARIDNVMVRQEGDIDIPNGGYIDDKNATVVTFEKSFKYTSSTGSELKASTYKTSLNTLSKADCEVKKYSDDPFLLEGEGYTGYSLTNYGGSSVFGKLQLGDKTKDFYIMKINNKDSIKNWAGKPITNSYALLNGGLTNPTLVRETHIYDANDNELYVTGGKFPHNAAKVVFTLTTKVAKLPEASAVKIGDVASSRYENIYTVDLSNKPLEQAKSYVIKVGNHTKTYKTTGTNPYATAYIETFDSGNEMFTNSDKTNITLTNENGRIKYENKLDATVTPPRNITYNFGEFDFTKGSMLVSFDLTLNQAIKWLNAGSHCFNPQMLLGDKPIGYMPAIETTGLRARDEKGGRVKTNDEKDIMNKGDTVTISTLFTYYPDEKKIGYIQFADGRRLYNSTTEEPIPVYYIADADAVINSAASIRFGGRNFADGGLYIDNLMMTTVDGITANDVMEISNATATVNVESTVKFADGTNEDLTNPVFTNNAQTGDFNIKEYSKDDKLRLKGTAATGVEYSKDNGSFTFGKLDSSKDYVVELKDGSKIKCVSGKNIDTLYFTTAANSVLKTTVLNGDETEICADSDGKIPSNAAKIKIKFTKDVIGKTVSVGNLSATSENGEYVFDFTNEPLEANKEYTVKVDGADFAGFTTTDGAVTVNKPVISDDGKASVTVTNTTKSPVTVYIISATYAADETMVDVVWEVINAEVGNTDYTMTGKPDSTGAATQKAFVWDGFTKLNPLCPDVSKTISSN